MLFRKLILLAILLTATMVITAQDDEAVETETEIQTELPRSYTQADLNVLVGNVQRPNGIVWLNNNLYTACNGDWTLYEINSETGRTRSLVFNIRNAHAMYGEVTDAGYNLWIPDFERDTFSKLDQNLGAPDDLVSSELMDGPWGISPVDDEQFLITNVRADNIVVSDRAGEARVVIDGLRSPAGIVVEGDYGYVVNNGSARRAIEWFAIEDVPLADAEAEPVGDVTQPLVRGLQNASNLILGNDGYLYFTYALGTRGVVGRVNPDECRDGGCSNDQVEIVIFTELQAPLAGLALSDDNRIFMHTIYEPNIYWVNLYNPDGS